MREEKFGEILVSYMIFLRYLSI